MKGSALTASQLAELGAFGALPERAVKAAVVVTACVRVVADPLHALRQAVRVLCPYGCSADSEAKEGK